MDTPQTLVFNSDKNPGYVHIYQDPKEPKDTILAFSFGTCCCTSFTDDCLAFGVRERVWMNTNIWTDMAATRYRWGHICIPDCAFASCSGRIFRAEHPGNFLVPVAICQHPRPLELFGNTCGVLGTWDNDITNEFTGKNSLSFAVMERYGSTEHYISMRCFVGLSVYISKQCSSSSLCGKGVERSNTCVSFCIFSFMFCCCIVCSMLFLRLHNGSFLARNGTVCPDDYTGAGIGWVWDFGDSWCELPNETFALEEWVWVVYQKCQMM